MNRKVVDITEIISLIPIGHENAINLEKLTEEFEKRGWLDDCSPTTKSRVVRKMIERTGYEYVICNLQDGHGYFRPTADDLSSYKKWLNQEQARLEKISKRLKIGRALFEDFLRDRLKEQKI